MKRVILALAASLVWSQALAQSDRVKTLCGETIVDVQAITICTIALSVVSFLISYFV